MTTPPDPFEFVRNLWSQMGIPGFGAGANPAMPSFAPEDLERRVAELKQIRQWLEINLNMLNLQVNGLEMQLSALKGFKASPGGEMAAQATRAMQDAVSGQGMFAAPPAAPVAAAPFTPAAFAGFQFGAAAPVAPAPEPAPRAEAPPAAPAPAWPDPTSWMQNLQAEFVKNMKSIAPGDAVRAGPAPKKAATKSTARKTGAKPRTRGAP